MDCWATFITVHTCSRKCTHPLWVCWRSKLKLLCCKRLDIIAKEKDAVGHSILLLQLFSSLTSILAWSVSCNTNRSHRLFTEAVYRDLRYIFWTASAYLINYIFFKSLCCRYNILYVTWSHSFSMCKPKPKPVVVLAEEIIFRVTTEINTYFKKYPHL